MLGSSLWSWRSVARHRLTVVAVSVSLLGGCASAPPGGNTSPVQWATLPAKAVAKVPTEPARPVVAQASAAAVTAVDSAAVAARLPDVGPRYAAPALQPGHAGFTDQTELASFLAKLAAPPPRGAGKAPWVSVLRMGLSQAGVPLEALLLTRHTAMAPEALARGGRPTVLLVGQQHGDEPASAEALLALAHELARGSLQPLLERINVIIVPRANPDGAARGQAATANGLDLDQDHVLLRTPEAQALAKLVLDYVPPVVVDVREYPVQPRYAERLGGVQRADVQVQYATTALQHEFVTKAAEAWFRQPLVDSLVAAGLTHDWHHRLSDDPADKTVRMGGAELHSLRNVQGLRHAVSLLAETRGAGLGRAHLQRRVHTQMVLLGSVLQSAAQRGGDLARLRKYVEADVSAQACRGPMTVQAETSPSEYTLALFDAATGADKPVMVTWQSALALRARHMRPRPCGYWLDAGQSAAVARLRQLGVRVDQLEAPGVMRGEAQALAPDPTQVSAQSPTPAPPAASAASAAERAANSFDVPSGSYHVPLGQPLALVVVAALESNGVAPNTGPIAEVRRVMAPTKIKRTALP